VDDAQERVEASAPPDLTPHTFGFASIRPEDLQDPSERGWTKAIGEYTCTFRVLTKLVDLGPTEALQREVLGASDLDLTPASEMVVVEETGGFVLGAYRELAGVDEMIGVSVSWGGYYHRRPRLVSDLLLVRADMRSVGLGAEMKKLQAAIALERGFNEIVWTVDPLRAANARLNFEKLGAICHHYEINRYGAGYGAGLYGEMPTDRLHMEWNVASPRVHERLLGTVSPQTTAEIEDLLHFDPGRSNAERALVYLPSNIDTLLPRDPNAALRWRLTLRETLQLAFERNYAITGFVPETDPERGLSSYVLTRRDILTGG
jgi:predicted GNAT superfamily acetyltransferase